MWKTELVGFHSKLRFKILCRWFEGWSEDVVWMTGFDRGKGNWNNVWKKWANSKALNKS